MKLPPLPKPSLLARLSLVLTSGLAIVAGFALASLLFVVLLIAGMAVAGWLWWQYRRLISQARRAAPDYRGRLPSKRRNRCWRISEPTNPTTRPRHNGCHE